MGAQQLPALRVGKRLSQVPGGDEARATVVRGPGATHVWITPAVVAPVCDTARFVEARTEANGHGRAVWLPGMFILAHPFQRDGSPGYGARQQRGVQRSIVGAVMPIAACAFHMNDVDIGGVHV